MNRRWARTDARRRYSTTRTCEELAAPIEVPEDAYERARSQRVANEVATLEVALASLFVEGRCPPSIETDVVRTLAAELDADSCDQLARWRFERSSHDAALEVGALVRGCTALSERTRRQLSALIITCTTTSRHDEQDHRREQRQHERS